MGNNKIDNLTKVLFQKIDNMQDELNSLRDEVADLKKCRHDDKCDEHPDEHPDFEKISDIEKAVYNNDIFFREEIDDKAYYFIKNESENNYRETIYTIIFKKTHCLLKFDTVILERFTNLNRVQITQLQKLNFLDVLRALLLNRKHEFIDYIISKKLEHCLFGGSYNSEKDLIGYKLFGRKYNIYCMKSEKL